MDNGQVVFLLLTLMMCYDLVELFEVKKRFTRASRSFNHLFFDTSREANSDELTSANKKVEHYERQIRSIKLKFMLKMLTKFVIECVTRAADYPIAILDFCLIIFAVCLWFHRPKRV
ncbi:MAG: hypothetical protein J6A36_03200 [Clostridia bacterium]|nr:hypothetical protein [Clostridia bacterium]